MPYAPPTICQEPGCTAMTKRGRYCAKHRAERAKTKEQRAKAKASEYDQQRGNASARGYDKRWQRARLAYLQENPLCAICKQKGITMAASVVDHIVPHRGDRGLFWDTENWQSLCITCHNSKTARGE